MPDERPALTALIAYWLVPYGFLTKPRVVSLEVAADFSRHGWTVLVDPQDEEDLVRWEQATRSLGVARKWPDPS